MDQVRDLRAAYDALLFAFAIGYRSVDTASSYGNESAAGRAVADSGIDRSEFFITTKVKARDHGFDRTLRAFDRSVAAMGVEYLDSYLIHWPGKYLLVDTWRALERLYDEGRVRAIGVCNCNPHHIETLLSCGEMTPMINQVEWHVYFQQHEVARYCRQHDILLEGWSPLMCGGAALEDPKIVEIAERKGCTAAQVMLRWHVQSGRRVFPKSVTPQRIAENFDIWRFVVTERELAEIDQLGMKNIRIGPDPDMFFMN
jgi:diketogulonate reductase-like aldo/keto reductase